MRFLFASSTAVLAALLIPTSIVAQERYYKCDKGQIFSVWRIKSYAENASLDKAKKGDPLSPSGRRYPTYRFITMEPGEPSYDFIIQEVDDVEIYRVYRSDPPNWIQCTTVDASQLLN
ncbi:BgTH12-02073 [Blumeria graminis f. sp. triticale]|uniref:BgtE-20035 n=3 Tax=Blumeria graminis TaxID=34373 RepID=A0A381L401_BLUGR|nr:BgTH12-02073 [Blumeria graminis f. sp. triticale]VDB85698.1 BgtE-20035 [Blumeria graminis f. sp. tritici]